MCLEIQVSLPLDWVTQMQTWVRTLSVIVSALVMLGAISEEMREQGVTDAEIRIGNLMPYSGNLEVFGAI